jgi:hypothetical protein
MENHVQSPLISVDPFAHFNAIANAKSGDRLIVVEPVLVVPNEGGQILLPKGTKLQISCSCGTVIFADALLSWFRTKHVTLSSDEYGSVDLLQ